MAVELERGASLHREGHVDSGVVAIHTVATATGEEEHEVRDIGAFKAELRKPPFKTTVRRTGCLGRLRSSSS